MRKLFTLLSGVVLASSIYVLASMSPAAAETTITQCGHVEWPDTGSADDVFCMQPTFSKDAGNQGFYVADVRTWCRMNAWDFGWDHPAVDADYFKIRNVDNETTVFNRTSEADVDTSDHEGGYGACNKIITVNEHYPNAHQIRFWWQGIHLRIDKTTDQFPEDVKLLVTNG